MGRSWNKTKRGSLPAHQEMELFHEGWCQTRWPCSSETWWKTMGISRWEEPPRSSVRKIMEKKQDKILDVLDLLKRYDKNFTASWEKSNHDQKCAAWSFSNCRLDCQSLLFFPRHTYQLAGTRKNVSDRVLGRHQAISGILADIPGAIILYPHIYLSIYLSIYVCAHIYVCVYVW